MPDDLTISIDDPILVLAESAEEFESVTVAEKGDPGPPGPQGPPGPPGSDSGDSELDTAEIVAAENLPALCFITSGGNIADSENPFHFNRVLGILMSPVVVDNVATVVIEGEVTDPSWSWSPNLKLFLNGTQLSTTPPSSGFSQLVGLTRNSNTIFVRLQIPIRL